MGAAVLVAGAGAGPEIDHAWIDFDARGFDPGATILADTDHHLLTGALAEMVIEQEQLNGVAVTWTRLHKTPLTFTARPQIGSMVRLAAGLVTGDHAAAATGGRKMQMQVPVVLEAAVIHVGAVGGRCRITSRETTGQSAS